jgi:hypothetical protein
MSSSGSVIVEVTDEKHSGMVAFNFSIGRVDLIVNGKSLDATNIVNSDFKNVNGITIQERLEKWGHARLKHFHTCDVCNQEKYAPPLAKYDIKNFPDLEGKTVCRDCRAARYNVVLRECLEEQKNEWLSHFPNAGPIKVTDINLCTEPKCNCGWRITIKVKERRKKDVLKGLPTKEVAIIRVKGNVITISGHASQWPQLAKICELAGGKLPDGYPPSLK